MSVGLNGRTLIHLSPLVHTYLNRVTDLQGCGMRGRSRSDEPATVYKNQFQYVGYIPGTDQAIIQYIGSKTASQMPAKDLMQMGAAGSWTVL